ncbi:MAG: hypothetical protein AABZ02_03300 [Bacteroidota bacterium]
MVKTTIVPQVGQRGADLTAMVDRIIEKPREIAELIEVLKREKGTVKYAYEKVLRLVSERRPTLIYPYFDVFARLLDSDNSFLKWGAIMTVAHLAAVDAENKFETIFEKYYAPIAGPTMVTAANIIGSSAKIVLAKPELAGRIAREILRVEKATYERQGSPSPECRNVAIGHAIDSFEQFFEQIDDQVTVIRFVERQLSNTRKQVVKKAERFICKYGK